MNNWKILIVEGNTSAENINFHAAGCVSKSDNFKVHIKKVAQNRAIDLE